MFDQDRSASSIVVQAKGMGKPQHIIEISAFHTNLLSDRLITISNFHRHENRRKFAKNWKANWSRIPVKKSDDTAWMGKLRIMGKPLKILSSVCLGFQYWKFHGVKVGWVGSYVTLWLWCLLEYFSSNFTIKLSVWIIEGTLSRLDSNTRIFYSQCDTNVTQH